MATKKAAPGSTNNDVDMTPLVAATLAGVIYHAKLMNRQSKLNIPEEEVVGDVVSLWQTVMHELSQEG
jgi:hypothetical protein